MPRAAILVLALASGCGTATGPVSPCWTTIHRSRPSLVLVFDRGHGMNAVLPDGRTYAEALPAIVEQALSGVADVAYLGAIEAPTGSPLTENCHVATGLSLGFAVGEVSRVTSFMRGFFPNGTAPTSADLDVAGGVLGLRPEPDGLGAVLLAEHDTGGCDLNSNAQPDAVRALATSGVPTIVFSFVDPVRAAGDPVLGAVNESAIAGGFPRTGAERSFFDENSVSELAQTLRRALLPSYWCRGRLGNEGRPTHGARVFADSIGWIDSDGWRWSDATHSSLEITGTYCESVIEARSDIRIVSDSRCSL